MALVLTDKNVDYVVSELKAILNGSITPLNAATAVLQGVLVMRKFNTLSGSQKKSTLMAALDVLVHQNGGSADDQATLECLIEFMAPTVIDGFFWFATSGVKMVETSCGCFSSGKNPV